MAHRKRLPRKTAKISKRDSGRDVKECKEAGQKSAYKKGSRDGTNGGKRGGCTPGRVRCAVETVGNNRQLFGRGEKKVSHNRRELEQRGA